MNYLSLIAIASAVLGKFYEYWRKNWQSENGIEFDPRYIWEWLMSGGLAWIVTEALSLGSGLSVSTIIEAIVVGFGSGFSSHEVLKSFGLYKNGSTI